MSQFGAALHSMPLIDPNPTLIRPCPVCRAPVPAGATYCTALCQVFATLQSMKADADRTAEGRGDARVLQYWRGRGAALGDSLDLLRVLIDGQRLHASLKSQPLLMHYSPMGEGALCGAPDPQDWTTDPELVTCPLCQGVGHA